MIESSGVPDCWFFHQSTSTTYNRGYLRSEWERGSRREGVGESGGVRERKRDRGREGERMGERRVWEREGGERDKGRKKMRKKGGVGEHSNKPLIRCYVSNPPFPPGLFLTSENWRRFQQYSPRKRGSVLSNHKQFSHQPHLGASNTLGDSNLSVRESEIKLNPQEKSPTRPRQPSGTVSSIAITLHWFLLIL